MPYTFNPFLGNFDKVADLSSYVPYTGATDNVDLGSYNLTASSFISTVAIGTQPYAATSTTLNTNLNADLLDSQEGSYYLAWANFTGTPTTLSGYGISDTMANFDIALSDGNFAFAGGAFHDGFSDFVANEHIDWTNASDNFKTTGNLAIRSDTGYIDLGATADDYKIQWDGSDAVHTITAGDFVFTGGNVGIGTTGPVSLVNISGGDLTIDNGEFIRWNSSVDATRAAIVADTSENLNFYTGNGLSSDFIRMTINSSGNVGIGTAGPGAKLDVRTSSTDAQIRLVDDAQGGASSQYAEFFFDDGGQNSLDISTKFVSDTNKIFLSPGGATAMTLQGNGNVGIGTTSPNQKLTIEGTIDLKEQAAANSDTAAYGQIWVADTTPNELWFTDDAGTDTQLSSHPQDAPKELYTNGAGLDWIGKRVQKYLGEIYWQTIDGKITIETFEEYNARRENVEGHIDLVKKDWNEVHREKAIAEYEKEEVEITLEEAIEEIEITEEIESEELETKYIFVEGKIETEETSKKVEQGTGEFRTQFKEGIRLDSDTGKLYRKRTREEAEAKFTPEDIPTMPKWVKSRKQISL